MQIFVNSFSGKRIPFEVKPDDLIKDIKDSLILKEGIPWVEHKKLIFEGQELEDEKTLEDYNIRENATLEEYIPIRGGDAGFINMDQTEHLRELQWNRSAPKWPVACNGISIEGICESDANSCSASGKMVIYPFGIGTFDLLNHEAKCPICKNPIKPIKPGFSNCRWSCKGFKADGFRIMSPLKTVGNCYTTYDEDKTGKAQYTSLFIQAKPLPPPPPQKTK